MIHDMIGGGGGASLNFKVVGSTSAPASPKENTIWVNTSTEITSWVFSATEPETPAAGMVWISVGESSPVAFNALKKNNITVYPLTAKQYVSGAWVDKEAKSYQNGAWVDWWNGELYKNGDEYENITGGWIGTPKKYDSASNAVEATITRGSTTITMKPNGDGGCLVHTANKIDLTNYSKLIFDGKVSGATAYASLANMRVWSDFGTYQTSNAVATASLQYHSNGEVTLDVSKLTGSYYIGFGLHASGTVVMRSMHLE